jgi:predicted negative regulator of RcsB-dependent stress response
MNRQRGFSAVEAIIIVSVVVALALVGWWVYDRAQKDDATENTDTSQQDSSVPEVNNATDLDSAEQSLDNADVDAGTADESELDNELNSF